MRKRESGEEFEKGWKGLGTMKVANLQGLEVRGKGEM
jgi:hypothetical protein